MKRIFIIVCLFVLILNSFGQSGALTRDVIIANDELYIRDSTFQQLLENYISLMIAIQADSILANDYFSLRDSSFSQLVENYAPTGLTANSGINIVGSEYVLGGTPLNQETTINGNSYNLYLGQILSKLSNLYINTSDDFVVNADDEIQLSANGIAYVWDGVYWINTTTNDTLSTLADVESLISASEPLQPLQFKYLYSSTTTDSRPGVGVFRTNNITPQLVTQIYIDDFDNSTLDKSDWIRLIDTGSYYMIYEDDTKYRNYKITGGYINDAGYYKLNVDHQYGQGGQFTSGVQLTHTLDISNSTGSGGGGAVADSTFDVATINKARIDTIIIRAYDGSFYTGDSTIINDDGGNFIINSPSEINIMSSNEIVLTSDDEVQIESGGIGGYYFDGDTLYANGENFSTANSIKAKNLYATDNVEADSIIANNITSTSQTMDGTTVTSYTDSKTVIEGTITDYLTTDSLNVGKITAVDLDTVQNEYSVYMNPITKEITAREPTHLYGYFQDESEVVAVTQNVWYQVTNTTNDIFTIPEAVNISGANDSIFLLQDGHYMINYHIQAIGSNSDVLEIRIYNVTQAESVLPTHKNEMAGAADIITVGGLVYCTNCNDGDELVFQFRNITGNDNITLVSGSGFIEMTHAE